MRRCPSRVPPAATLLITAVVIELALVSSVFADVVSYEASTFPDEDGWTLLQNYCEPELWVEAGWFHQHVEMCPGDPPPGGQSSVYRRSLADFIGEDQFFIDVGGGK